MGMFDKMAKRAADALEAAVEHAEGAEGDEGPAPGAGAGGPGRRGACPACGSPTVHRAPDGRFQWDVGEAGRGRAVVLGTSRMVRASPVETLVCVTCGHLRHFVDDPGRLAEVAAAWERVPDDA